MSFTFLPKNKKNINGKIVKPTKLTNCKLMQSKKQFKCLSIYTCRVGFKLHLV